MKPWLVIPDSVAIKKFILKVILILNRWNMILCLFEKKLLRKLEENSGMIVNFFFCLRNLEIKSCWIISVWFCGN